MIIIDASNLKGLGAKIVGLTIINNIIHQSSPKEILIIIPDPSFFPPDFILTENIKVKTFIGYGKPFYWLFRLGFLIFGSLWLGKSILYTLGDIPILFKTNQIVFVHQANIISPSVEPNVSKNLSFKIQRFLFYLGSRYVKKVDVQTKFMVDKLVESYPFLEGKVFVKPAKYFFNIFEIDKNNDIKCQINVPINKKLNLIFPASFYPHKNHGILDVIKKNWCQFNQYINLIYITLDNDIYDDYDFVQNVGTLNYEEAKAFYQMVDGLFFPSKLESFGLPLAEFNHLNKIIVCPRLGYSESYNQSNIFKFHLTDITELKLAFQEAFTFKNL